MKRPLLVKLISAMGALVLISGLTSSLIIGLNTKKAFRSLIRENDVILSRAFSTAFKEYYHINGSWKGISEIINDSEVLWFGMKSMSSDRSYSMHGQSVMGPSIKMVLTDGNGRLITHTLEEDPPLEIPESLLYEGGRTTIDKIEENKNVPSKVSKEVLEDGTPIVVDNGNIVGYLFVGSMAETFFGQFKSKFLSGVFQSIIISTLFVALVAIGIASIIFRNIMKPLEGLKDATKKMSRGNYQVETGIKRKDELGVLAKSFETMASELKKADEWKKRLIIDSAHELRTPVALLQGNLEMMREGVYPADEEHLDRLYEETLMLSKLVAELRELADAESVETSLNFEIVDVHAILSNLIDSYQAAALSKSVIIDFDLRNATQESTEQLSESFKIYGTKHKLKQALSNIFSNAMRYTTEGGKIHVELELDDNHVCIAIEDTGKGIPVDEREKIFERFYRTDVARNRATGGLGLGLSVAKKIVEAHKGDISAKDPKQLNGSRFEVNIPAAENSK